MSVLNSLKPALLWKYFEDITQIPRPSKKEEKVIEYLTRFAKENKLDFKKDATGNVLISKPATPGFEKYKSVCLQSHMDMVCEKNSNSSHNFEKDPIKVYIDDGWIKAKDTTLGADNGIGIAAALAVLADKNIQHGPVECLFTVDEETGLNGAMGLESGFLKSKTLINLDSEDEGELFIGCAGGVNTVATLRYGVRKTPEDSLAYRIDVTGLQGGHSGTDIQKNRGSSIKILNQILWEVRNRFDVRLSVFEGGNLHNAIPREAFAVIVVPNEYKEVFEAFFHDYSKILIGGMLPDEPGVKIILSKTDLPGKVMKKKAQEKLLNALYACPHGVIAWSRVMENLVETSTNLASVKFEGDHRVVICTSQRSSVDAARQNIANMVKSTFKLAGAKVEPSDGYPGWNPNPKSQILKISVRCYTALFKNKPAVKAIHAGLECGLFLEKYPYLDMISFGPTILDAHSPGEKLNIETTGKFWDLLLDVLKNVK